MITKNEKDEINEGVEKLFSKQIDVNFLKEMLWKTLDKYPILYSYYHYNNKNLIEILPSANIYNVICKHIIGIHNSKTFDLNNKEISKFEREENHQKDIVDKVWQMISIRYPQSESFFLHEPLIQNYEYCNGSPIIYYPYLFFIANICLKVINCNSIPYPEKTSFYKVLAFLSLLHNDFLNEAYALLRTVLEEYAYNAIYLLHRNAYTERVKWAGFYNGNNEFEEKYKKSLEQNKKLNKKIIWTLDE